MECKRQLFSRPMRMFTLAAFVFASALSLFLPGCALYSPKVKVAPTEVSEEKISALVANLEAEWMRWGGHVAYIDRMADLKGTCLSRLDGSCIVVADGCGQEQSSGLCNVVNEYWTTFEKPSHNCAKELVDVCEIAPPAGASVAKNEAWSAAFISAMMLKSGFSKTEFATSRRHAEYIADARDAYSSSFEVVPTPANVSPGDLVCAGRMKGIVLYPSMIAKIRKGYELHCDVVVRVDVAARRAEAIGGNVQQTVAKTVLPLDDSGRVGFDETLARKWALVMKIRKRSTDSVAQH